MSLLLRIKAHADAAGPSQLLPPTKVCYSSMATTMDCPSRLLWSAPATMPKTRELVTAEVATFQTLLHSCPRSAQSSDLVTPTRPHTLAVEQGIPQQLASVLSRTEFF